MQPDKLARFVALKGTAFKEFALAQEPNLGVRKYMEDKAFMADCFLQHCPKSALFGIFDGHGGDQVSLFLHKHLPQIIRESKVKQKKKMLEEAFAEADRRILALEMQAGSTGTVCLLTLEDATRVLYAGCVGDSSAYIFDDSSFEKLTVDHRGANSSQAIRVKESGGKIINGRLHGLLAVTRAFGDKQLKTCGLIARPDVKRVEVRLSHRYVVVGSDGLWDFVNATAVQQILKDEGEADTAARKLVKAAVQSGSEDNISVIVVKL